MEAAAEVEDALRGELEADSLESDLLRSEAISTMTVSRRDLPRRAEVSWAPKPRARDVIRLLPCKEVCNGLGDGRDGRFGLLNIQAGGDVSLVVEYGFVRDVSSCLGLPGLFISFVFLQPSSSQLSSGIDRHVGEVELRVLENTQESVNTQDALVGSSSSRSRRG